MNAKKGVPPGFEGQPLYRHYTPKEYTQFINSDNSYSLPPMTNYTNYANTKNMGKINKKDSYATIQNICAEKLNIYLPSIGYCHIVLEDENPSNMFEIAYKNEFNKNKSSVPVNGMNGGKQIEYRMISHKKSAVQSSSSKEESSTTVPVTVS